MLQLPMEDSKLSARTVIRQIHASTSRKRASMNTAATTRIVESRCFELSDKLTHASVEDDGQQRLVEPEETGSDSTTVYVVAAQHCDDPHPLVKGVYTSEEDAKERKDELFDSWPICAIGVYEQEVDPDAGE